MAEVEAVPKSYEGVIVSLNLARAADAIGYMCTAFGGEEVAKMLGPDGRLMHAEVRVNGALLFISEAQTDPVRTASLVIYVRDCDSVFGRALATGGTQVMAPTDMFWGDRMGRLEDPFGNLWTIATHMKDLTPEEMAAAVAPKPA